MANRIDIIISGRNQSGPAFDSVKNDLRQLDQLAGTLNQGLQGLAIAGGVGAIVAGLTQVGGAIVDLSRNAASVDRLRTSFDQLASGVGESSSKMLDALRQASGGAISDADLFLQANRANLLGVAQSTDDLVKLLEIAAARGKATGRTISEAFEDITLGVGRESKLILDNLGFLVDIEGAQSAYAESIGKTTDQLSNIERKQAIVNQLYADSADLIAQQSASGDDLANKFERMDAAIQNAKTALGELFAPAVAVVAENIAAAAQAAVTQLNNLDASQLEGQLQGLLAIRAGLESGLTRARADIGTPFGDPALLDELLRKYEEVNRQIYAITKNRADLNRAGANPEINLVTNLTAARAQIEREAQAIQAALDAALADAPDQLQRLVRAEIKLDADIDTSTLAGKLRASLDGLVDRRSAPELTELVNSLKDEFETLSKTQETTKQRIIANAVQAADIVGDQAAFGIAERQIAELQDRIDALGIKLFDGDLGTDQFLYELNRLPGAVTAVFDDISAAGAEGADGLRARLAGMLDLREALQVSGSTTQLDALNTKIAELETTLGIIDPAAQSAAASFNYLIPAAGGAGVALDGAQVSAAQAEAEINALTGALASAPAALSNLASAAIAAGADVATVAAQVAGLRAEFAALEGAQAGVRRSIISRAASISGIVGDERALALATEQLGALDTRIGSISQQLYDGTITAEEYEYQLAKLDSSFTGVFGDIEEADRKSKQLAATVGKDVAGAFNNLQSKVQSVLSGAFNVDVGVDPDKLLPREDAINEDARRLADVAVRGWDSPWASYLSQKFPDLIGEAFEGGGDVKQTAARILRDFEDGLVPQLIDKDTAKERVRRALLGEANTAALAKEIAAELAGEFGGQFSASQIQATAGVTLGVQGSEVDQVTAALSGAGGAISQNLAGLGSSVKSGITAALDGIGETITTTLDKQLHSDANLKIIRQAGYDNGIKWGDGFAESISELSSRVLNQLADLVTPYVDSRLRQSAQLQGAN